MSKLLVIDVVSLERKHLVQSAPALAALGRSGFVAELTPPLPAVTCTSQSSMLTGKMPAGHGIVGNGWYFKDLAEVLFWRQSNHLVEAPKVWHALRERDPALTAAKLFWWYNMYADVDWSVTVRPHYTNDGLKFPGIYTHPAALEKELEADFGVFPLFHFWGPESNITSSRWIVDAACRVLDRKRPDLQLVYLPHVDYDFQRFGPDSPQAYAAVSELDREAGRLITHAQSQGYTVLVVSEYAMHTVDDAVMINKALREEGWIALRESRGRELLDCGASRAFAVADHQVAHVYVKDKADREAVKQLLSELPGVDAVLDREAKAAAGLDHPRSGDLVALSKPDRWFAYPWWLDDAKAPDFAHCVDIHRKPGYDPLELFYDPGKSLPRVRAACKLIRKRLGFRTVFDLIGFDTSLVHGSHGLVSPAGQGPKPLVIGSDDRFARDHFHAVDIFALMQQIIFKEACNPS